MSVSANEGKTQCGEEKISSSKIQESTENEINANNISHESKNRKSNSQLPTIENNLSTKDQTENSLKLLKFVADSQFTLTQVNGQRKFGPPPGWTGPPPGKKCEIFVGSIPRNYYEPEIVLIFSTVGKIYELRLMMDFSGTNRGYCFIMYTTPEEAARAVKELDQFEIYPGKRIGVVASINNSRLFFNQLSKNIDSKTIIKRIYEMTDDVENVGVYKNVNGEIRYVLVSYKTHRGAAMARRRLVPESLMLFENCNVKVEWANPSMVPSNIYEECGTCDEYGNVEIKKSYVGSVEMKKQVTPIRYQRSIDKRSNTPSNQGTHRQVNRTIQKVRAIKAAPGSSLKCPDSLSNNRALEKCQSTNQHSPCSTVGYGKNGYKSKENTCQAWDINGNVKKSLDSSLLYESLKNYEQQVKSEPILPPIRSYLNKIRPQKSSKWNSPRSDETTNDLQSESQIVPYNLSNVSNNLLNRYMIYCCCQYKIPPGGFNSEKLQSDSLYSMENRNWNSVDSLVPKFSGLPSISSERDVDKTRVSYEHDNLYKKEQQTDNNTHSLSFSVPHIANDADQQAENSLKYGYYYPNFAVNGVKQNGAATYTQFPERTVQSNAQNTRYPLFPQEPNRENGLQELSVRSLPIQQNFCWCFAEPSPSQLQTSDNASTFKQFNGISNGFERLNNHHVMNGSEYKPEIPYYDNRINNEFLSKSSGSNFNERLVCENQCEAKCYARPILKAGNTDIKVNY